MPDAPPPNYGARMDDAATLAEERRGCDRLPLSTAVEFRRVKQTAQKTLTHDVSLAGCRIDSAATLLEGERTWVRLPGIDSIPSTVRWSKEWTAGVSFDNPVHPAVFDMVVGRMREAA